MKPKTIINHRKDGLTGRLNVITRLKSLTNPANIVGMARFGINSKNMLGVPIPILRKMGKEIGKNHRLALELWDTDIHEARILATMIDDSKQVTDRQMEAWVAGFDSWGICDQCCSNLFDKTPFAHGKAIVWSKRKEEFIKRAGFTLMATLAVHDKKSDNQAFIKFLPIIKRDAIDERNFVKKAVNWALRQIGKRNMVLNKEAIQMAHEIEKMDSSSARWIAKDALRELQNENVKKRLSKIP
jgi:3-methyladenine DNA glycosylase AlkD